MEIIFQIIASSGKVFTEAAVYVIFGFIVAGMLRVYIQPDSVAHYFHRGRFKSVLYASLLGVPIPL
jgi:uncharacterized protein